MSTSPSSSPERPPPILILSSGYLIRPYSPHDAPSLVLAVNNPAVVRYKSTSFPSPYLLSDATSRITRILEGVPGVYRFFITTPDSLTVIGRVGLTVNADIRARTALLGYWLAEPYWGKGIMSEAVRLFVDWCFANKLLGCGDGTGDEKTGLLRIEAQVIEGNEGSVGVLRKAGFEFEGKRKGDAWKEGLGVRDVEGWVRFAVPPPLLPVGTTAAAAISNSASAPKSQEGRKYTLEAEAPSTRSPDRPPPILVLPQCLIRPYHALDAPSLATSANNPNVTKYMTNAFPSPYLLSDAESWIALVTSTPGMQGQHYIITTLDNLTVIGGIGLNSKSDLRCRTGELGYWLAEEWWGKGIMSEAVRAFTDYCFMKRKELDRIEALVIVGNDGSGRVLGKAGFAMELRRRWSVCKYGEVGDEECWARFREDGGNTWEGDESGKPYRCSS